MFLTWLRYMTSRAIGLVLVLLIAFFSRGVGLSAALCLQT